MKITSEKDLDNWFKHLDIDTKQRRYRISKIL